MHAAMAYINGAGARRIGKRLPDLSDIELLNTLLTAPGESPSQRGKDKSKDTIHSNEAKGTRK
jgi:hypothetical protein